MNEELIFPSYYFPCCLNPSASKKKGKKAKQTIKHENFLVVGKTPSSKNLQKYFNLPSTLLGNNNNEGVC